MHSQEKYNFIWIFQKKAVPLHYENDKGNNQDNDCITYIFSNCFIISLLHSRYICITDFTYLQLGNNSQMKIPAKVQNILILTK